MENMKTSFRADANAADKVKKQIDNLKKICSYYGIPMFATAALKDTENGTEYYSELYGATAHNIQLKEDRIRKHILIQDGFVPVPPREEAVFDSNLFDLIRPAEDIDEEDGEDIQKYDDDYEEEIDCSELIGDKSGQGDGNNA